MFNIYSPISVYRSARDHTGTTMPFADFMRLGKEQYSGLILGYRSLKNSIEELKHKLTEWSRYHDMLAAEIVSHENPLGGFDDCDDRREALRNAANTMAAISNEINRVKSQADEMKRRLPCATLSGNFSPTRAKDHLIKHSGFICIDIDDHFTLKNQEGKITSYEQDLSRVPELLASLPYILYAAHSVGGVGYFAIVPIAEIDSTHTHEWYFESLQEDFSQMGIVIDPSCRDTTRLRFCSYDTNPYRNAHAELYTGRSQFISRSERSRIERELAQRAARKSLLEQSRRFDPDRDYRNAVICAEQIVRRQVNIAESYDNWRILACCLAGSFGERGRQIFKDISSVSTKYNESDADKKFDNFLKSSRNTMTIATFFSMCKEYGITFMSR